MGKLSAAGVAAVLLLAANGPAMAQGYYPADPGYDQGPDYGPSEAPAEDLPPGVNDRRDPAFGGDPDGADPEEDYGYADPGQDPADGGDDGGPRYPGHVRPRLGAGFSQEGDRLRRDARRRADENPGRDHPVRNGEFRHRRQHPSARELPEQ